MAQTDHSGEPGAGGTGLPLPLRLLLDRVVRSRAAERDQLRRPGSQRTAELSARLDTLHALEEFAAALEQRGWPVPQPIQLDLRTHRAVCGGGTPTKP